MSAASCGTASDDLNRTGDVGDGDGLEAGCSTAEDREKRKAFARVANRLEGGEWTLIAS
jgi:hypothetical protein